MNTGCFSSATLPNNQKQKRVCFRYTPNNTNTKNNASAFKTGVLTYPHHRVVATTQDDKATQTDRPCHGWGVPLILVNGRKKKIACCGVFVFFWTHVNSWLDIEKCFNLYHSPLIETGLVRERRARSSGTLLSHLLQWPFCTLCKALASLYFNNGKGRFVYCIRHLPVCTSTMAMANLYTV